MNSTALGGRRRYLSLAVLLAAFALLTLACSSGASIEPGDQPVDRADLVNPAEDGEEALANLPEVSPPLGASDPRLVGSEDMTLEEFVQTIGGDLNAKWQGVFEGGNYAYSNAEYVLYDEPMPISGCEGVADPQMGPFYCSENMSVYYPLSWTDRSGQTPTEIGDFAVAVILAHEAGHHVQHLTGILQDPRLYTIQTELQADCLAGIWGRSVYEEGSLERGDVEEAIQSLQNVADLPGMSPTDPRAHGNAEQRVDAFLTGYETGNIGRCRF